MWWRWKYMGVSENRGTPKSSILIGISIINHPFWGTTIFGNTHMYNIYIWLCMEVLAVTLAPPFTPKIQNIPGQGWSLILVNMTYRGIENCNQNPYLHYFSINCMGDFNWFSFFGKVDDLSHAAAPQVLSNFLIRTQSKAPISCTAAFDTIHHIGRRWNHEPHPQKVSGSATADAKYQKHKNNTKLPLPIIYVLNTLTNSKSNMKMFRFLRQKTNSSLSHLWKSLASPWREVSHVIPWQHGQMGHLRISSSQTH